MLEPTSQPSSQERGIGFVDAAAFGFSPAASGLANAVALQLAVDGGGTIVVSQPGTYNLARTVYVGSDTTVRFGNGVRLQKVDEEGPFVHVLLNKGALTRTYDHNIEIDGLHIVVNGIDVRHFVIYGLHGQLAFFYVKDLRITRFRCLDLGKTQFGVHVCTFEDLIIDDVIIKGKKDGVHLGLGKRFTIRNGVFETFDDAVALNAHDYSVSNPELGWIEDGTVEKCYDLNAENTVGFFCRILAGAWVDWRPGMQVQESDTVVCNGRVYRVQMKPDGQVYISHTPPSHESGRAEVDGIMWGMVQTTITHTCGVRNVTFRDIFLEKPRTAFSIHFDKDKWSRSYYPGADVPRQEQITFDNIRVLHDQSTPLLSVNTPIDVVKFVNCSLKDNALVFHGTDADLEYGKTIVNLVDCTFNHDGPMTLLRNTVDGKRIVLQTSASVAPHDAFVATLEPGQGHVETRSDLPGLAKG